MVPRSVARASMIILTPIQASTTAIAFSRKRSSASTVATRPYSARRLAMANMLLVQMMNGSRVTPKTWGTAMASRGAVFHIRQQHGLQRTPHAACRLRCRPGR